MSLKVSRLYDHLTVTLNSRTDCGITRRYAFNSVWPDYNHAEQIDFIVRTIALDIIEMREKEHIGYHNRIVSGDEFIKIDKSHWKDFIDKQPKLRLDHCNMLDDIQLY